MEIVSLVSLSRPRLPDFRRFGITTCSRGFPIQEPWESALTTGQLQTRGIHITWV